MTMMGARSVLCLLPLLTLAADLPERMNTRPVLPRASENKQRTTESLLDLVKQAQARDKEADLPFRRAAKERQDLERRRNMSKVSHASGNKSRLLTEWGDDMDTAYERQEFLRNNPVKKSWVCCFSISNAGEIGNDTARQIGRVDELVQFFVKNYPSEFPTQDDGYVYIDMQYFDDEGNLTQMKENYERCLDPNGVKADILLGPSNHSWNPDATQIAKDNDMFIILWSTPPSTYEKAFGWKTKVMTHLDAVLERLTVPPNTSEIDDGYGDDEDEDEDEIFEAMADGQTSPEDGRDPSAIALDEETGAQRDGRTPEAVWTVGISKNCFHGKGATNHPCCSGTYTTRTLHECKQSCLEKSGCDGITYNPSNSRCYLRHKMNLTECATHAAWTSHAKTQVACTTADFHCSNGGTVKGMLGNCRCKCPSTLGGDHCDKTLCTGADHQCLHGGTVTGTIGNCSCWCPVGRTGSFCEKETNWTMGREHDTCDEVCKKLGKVCDEPMQSSLTTEKSVELAFLEAGYTCKGFQEPQAHAGTPYATGRSDDCAPIAKGSFARCNINDYWDHAPLCYCKKDPRATAKKAEKSEYQQEEIENLAWRLQEDMNTFIKILGVDDYGLLSTDWEEDPIQKELDRLNYSKALRLPIAPYYALGAGVNAAYLAGVRARAQYDEDTFTWRSVAHFIFQKSDRASLLECVSGGWMAQQAGYEKVMLQQVEHADDIVNQLRLVKIISQWQLDFVGICGDTGFVSEMLMIMKANDFNPRALVLSRLYGEVLIEDMYGANANYIMDVAPWSAPIPEMPSSMFLNLDIFTRAYSSCSLVTCNSEYKGHETPRLQAVQVAAAMSVVMNCVQAINPGKHFRDVVYDRYMWTELGPVMFNWQGRRAPLSDATSLRQIHPFDRHDPALDDAEHQKKLARFADSKIQLVIDDKSFSDLQSKAAKNPELYGPLLEGYTTLLQFPPWSSKEGPVYPCPQGCTFSRQQCIPCQPGRYQGHDFLCHLCQGFRENKGPEKYADGFGFTKCKLLPKEGADFVSSTHTPEALPGYYRYHPNIAEGKPIGPARGETWNYSKFSAVIDGHGNHICKSREQNGQLVYDGRFNPYLQTFSFVECHPKSICLGNNTCAGANAGMMCLACRAGYTQWGGTAHQKTCEKCHPQLWIVAKLVIMTAIWYFMHSFLLYVARWDFRRPDCVRLFVLKKFIQYAQMHGLVYEVVGGSAFLVIPDILIRPLELATADCLFHNKVFSMSEYPKEEREATLQTLKAAPIVLFMSGVIITFARALFAIPYQRYMREAPPFIQSLFGFDPVPLSIERLCTRITQSLVTFLFLMYPACIRASMLLDKCLIFDDVAHISKLRVLKGDTTFHCGEEAIFSTHQILLATIPLAVLILCMLYVRRNSHDMRTERPFSLLVTGYAADSWYVEILYLIRMATITIITLAVSMDWFLLQIGTVCFINVVAHILTRPMGVHLTMYNRWIEIYMSIAICCTALRVETHAKEYLPGQFDIPILGDTIYGVEGLISIILVVVSHAALFLYMLACLSLHYLDFTDHGGPSGFLKDFLAYILGNEGITVRARIDGTYFMDSSSLGFISRAQLDRCINVAVSSAFYSRFRETHPTYVSRLELIIRIVVEAVSRTFVARDMEVEVRRQKYDLAHQHVRRGYFKTSLTGSGLSRIFSRPRDIQPIPTESSPRSDSTVDSMVQRTSSHDVASTPVSQITPTSGISVTTNPGSDVKKSKSRANLEANLEKVNSRKMKKVLAHDYSGGIPTKEIVTEETWCNQVASLVDEQWPPPRVNPTVVRLAQKYNIPLPHGKEMAQLVKDQDLPLPDRWEYGFLMDSQELPRNCSVLEYKQMFHRIAGIRYLLDQLLNCVNGELEFQEWKFSREDHQEYTEYQWVQRELRKAGIKPESLEAMSQKGVGIQKKARWHWRNNMPHVANAEDGYIEVQSGDVIRVHKYIIAEAIPYSMHWFAQGPLELQRFKRDIVEKMVEFAYTGKCEVEQGKMKELFQCAERVKFDSLRNVVVQRMPESELAVNVRDLAISLASVEYDAMEHHLDLHHENVEIVPWDVNEYASKTNTMRFGDADKKRSQPIMQGGVLELRCGNLTGTLQDRGNHGHGRVFGVDFSPDGSMIATCGEDGCIRLFRHWGECKKIMPLHDIVYSVRFCQDDGFIVVALREGSAQVLDITDSIARQSEEAELEDDPFKPTGSKDKGKRFSREGLSTWAIEDNNITRVISNADVLQGTGANKGGELNATASVQYHDHFIDDKEEGPWQYLNKDGVVYAEGSPCGNWILTAGWHGNLNVYDTSGMSQAPVFRVKLRSNSDQTLHLHYAVFSPNSDQIAAACSDGHALVYRFDHVSKTEDAKPQNLEITIQRATDLGENIVSERSFRFGRRSTTEQEPKSSVYCIVHSTMSESSIKTNSLAIDNNCAEWNHSERMDGVHYLADLEFDIYEQQEGEEPQKALRASLPSPDWYPTSFEGPVPIVGGKWKHHGQLYVKIEILEQETASPKMVCNPKPKCDLKHSGSVHSAVFARCSDRVLTASLDRSARIWNVDEGPGGKLEIQLDHGEEVLFADMSPDGTRIATATLGDDRASPTVWVWHAISGQLLRKLPQTCRLVSAIAWSPCCTKFVLACSDGIARVIRDDEFVHKDEHTEEEFNGLTREAWRIVSSNVENKTNREKLRAARLKVARRRQDLRRLLRDMKTHEEDMKYVKWMSPRNAPEGPQDAFSRSAADQSAQEQPLAEPEPAPATTFSLFDVAAQKAKHPEPETRLRKVKVPLLDSASGPFLHQRMNVLSWIGIHTDDATDELKAERNTSIVPTQINQPQPHEAPEDDLPSKVPLRVAAHEDATETASQDGAANADVVADGQARTAEDAEDGSPMEAAAARIAEEKTAVDSAATERARAAAEPEPAAQAGAQQEAAESAATARTTPEQAVAENTSWTSSFAKMAPKQNPVISGFSSWFGNAANAASPTDTSNVAATSPETPKVAEEPSAAAPRPSAKVAQELAEEPSSQLAAAAGAHQSKAPEVAEQPSQSSAMDVFGDLGEEFGAVWVQPHAVSIMPTAAKDIDYL